MSKSRADSLQKLEAWVNQRVSQMVKLVGGQGTPGTRAAPSQSGNNDTKIGSRLDNAEVIMKGGKEYKRFKWQINKNADDPTLRKMADKNSHEVWSEADVEIVRDADQDTARSKIQDRT